MENGRAMVRQFRFVLDVRNESSTESVVVKKGRESPENILNNLSNELYTEKIILLESKQNLIILKKE